MESNKAAARRPRTAAAKTAAALVVSLAFLLSPSVDAFAPSSRLQVGVVSRTMPTSIKSRSTSELAAKKQKKKRSDNSGAGEGFGKMASQSESTPAFTSASTEEYSADAGLRSIDVDDSTSTSTLQPSAQLNLDPSLSPEEKSQAILRRKFGLKSFAEQQSNMSIGVAEAAEKKKNASRSKLRNLDSAWPEGADVFDVLPPSLLLGFGNFLKVGLVACTVMFVAAGFAIALEAWSVATKNPLPVDVDAFIVNVVEPNFTPGLLVLLGFSVTLGLFASAQLGSKSSTYVEKP